MEFNRTELMPGVFLSHLRSDKFKTACMSVTLLTQLRRETAAMNAVIPFVLRRGTTRYRDMEQLSRRMDELYGAAVEPVVRRIGEIQCIGFYGSFPEPDYLPGGEALLGGHLRAHGAAAARPRHARRPGCCRQYVDSGARKVLDIIRSRMNDKRSYALTRCIEEMCCYEDFAVSRFGSESEAENIHYKKLTRHYRELIQTCPVEIFYCGKTDFKAVSAAMRDAFSAMPRGEIDYDIGTDLRMNAVEVTCGFVKRRWT